jgi:sporulation protein YlmC with PRC-barrel domain
MPRKIQTLSATAAIMAAATLTGASGFIENVSDGSTGPTMTAQVESGRDLLSPAVMAYDTLHGLPVYDAHADPVGTVAEVRVDADGRVSGAIVEISGFLGIGGHRVDLALDDLAMRGLNREDKDLSVQLLLSHAELDRMPRFDG